METLESTLRELEAREKSQQNLDAIYVKDMFPSFQQEFKNSDIQDLENYSNYSLQNILDDLRHILMLMDGSPTPKFKVKQEFLIEVSQRILKKLQKGEKVEPEKSPNKTYAKLKEPTIMDKKENSDIQLPVIRRTKQGPAGATKVIKRRATPTKTSEKLVGLEDQPKLVQPSQTEEKKKDGGAEDGDKNKEKDKSKDKDKEKDKDKSKYKDKIQKDKIQQPAQKEEAASPTEANEENDGKDGKIKGAQEIRVKKVDKNQRPTSQGRKRPNDDKHKKAGLTGEGQENLSQIAEEVVNEENSDNETADTKDADDEKKKKWELTEDQEKQIKEMSAQYGVEIEALKNYLETKAAHNQFNWIGIKRLDKKVDINLEIAKLESEYE